MSAFVWLLWGLLHATFGGPVLLPAWSEEMEPAMMNGMPRLPFYRLPVFLHARSPLIPQQLFQPGGYRGAPPAGITGLLIPPLRQHQSVTDRVARAVEARCGAERVSVRVDRYQLRAWREPSRFRIGTCPPRVVTSRFLYFEHGLLDCGGKLQVVGGQLVYSYLLNYTPPSQGFVIRVSPINLPIYCYYNRFHYSYKVGFRPQVQHTTFLKSIRSKLTFSLTVCNAQWEALSPGHTFYLGEQVYFLAQTGTLLSGERLYVDSCQATSSEHSSSSPKVDIITNYGCMTDSRREDSNSQFLSGGGSVVKFSVDAFLFRGVSQIQYLHCTVSVGLTPSNIAKSCNFNKAAGRWEEVTASSSLCSCCDSVCTDTDMSVKSHVRSSGWHVEPNQEEKMTARLRSFKAEEEQEYVDQNLNLGGDQKDGLTFPQNGSDLKDQESVGREEWKLEEGSAKAKEEQTDEKDTIMRNEGSELLTMSDEATPKNESSQVGEEGPVLRSVVTSLSHKSSKVSTYGSDTRKNDSFGIKFNQSAQGSSEDLSNGVNSNNTLCPHSDSAGCEAVHSESLEEKGSYNGGQGTLYSAVGTEGPTLLNGNSSSASENGTSDLFLGPKRVMCVNIAENIQTPVQAIQSVGRARLGEDTNPQLRGLQTGKAYPQWLENLVCNDGESDLTGSTDQEHPLNLLTGEGNLNEDSGTRTTYPIFSHLADRSEEIHEKNPRHSAMITATASFQDSKGSPLADGRWAEVVPDWVMQHLAFLMNKRAQVGKD